MCLGCEDGIGAVKVLSMYIVVMAAQKQSFIDQCQFVSNPQPSPSSPLPPSFLPLRHPFSLSVILNRPQIRRSFDSQLPPQLIHIPLQHLLPMNITYLLRPPLIPHRPRQICPQNRSLSLLFNLVTANKLNPVICNSVFANLNGLSAISPFTMTGNLISA